MSDTRVNISSTPHVRSADSIERIMRDVCIALVPAMLAAAYFFGLRALAVIVMTVASCVLSEYLFQKIAKKPVTTGDYSAVVTGVLLALNLPVSAPLWMCVVGGAFAIFIVKQLFGGLGQNFMNPALGARAFLQTAYPVEMVSWTAPIRDITSFGSDAVSTATPLAQLKLEGLVPVQANYMDALFGNIGGSLGETCAIAIILGGVYLLARKVITWHVPVAYIATFMILTFIFGRHGLMTGFPFYEVLVGGVLLGAFFMATDYSSSPITGTGRLIMGFGCGLLTFIIRVYGGYPEGTCYSILLMNLCVPLIDRYVKPRVYGVKKAKMEGKVENNA